MAAAECLHHLNLRLRQSKAALANEHHGLVVARKRRADALAPLVNSARISAELLIAGQRRKYALAAKEASAYAVVERSERARVAREEQAKFKAEIMRARIECKLVAAAARKEQARLEKRFHGKSSSSSSAMSSLSISPRAHSGSSTPPPTSGGHTVSRSRPASAASRADEKPVMGGHAVPAWGLSSIVPAPQRTAAHPHVGETEAAVQTPAEWDVKANLVEVEAVAVAQWARPRVSDGALSDDSARATRKVSKTACTVDKSVTANPVAASAPAPALNAPAPTSSDKKKYSGAKAERLGFLSWMQGVMMAEADAKEAADELIGTHPLPDADDEWEVVSSEADGDLVLV